VLKEKVNIWQIARFRVLIPIQVARSLLRLINYTMSVMVSKRNLPSNRQCDDTMRRVRKLSPEDNNFG
jgi:hypothetical protein